MYYGYGHVLGILDYTIAELLLIIYLLCCTVSTEADFCFSPAAPAVSEDLASAARVTTSQQTAFSFTPPIPATAPAVAKQRSDKPARPIRITLPTTSMSL